VSFPEENIANPKNDVAHFQEWHSETKVEEKTSKMER
jgi:hypothetical protein